MLFTCIYTFTFYRGPQVHSFFWLVESILNMLYSWGYFFKFDQKMVNKIVNLHLRFIHFESNFSMNCVFFFIYIYDFNILISVFLWVVSFLQFKNCGNLIFYWNSFQVVEAYFCRWWAWDKRSTVCQCVYCHSTRLHNDWSILKN